MITPATNRRPNVTRSGVPLTQAESEVLEFLVAGYSNKEIATALRKAEPTVKHQVSSILHKHRVPSRARLIARLGVLPCASAYD